MRTTFVLAAAFTAAVCAAGEGGYDLYLLIGQSNMAGRGKVDEKSKRAHPRV